MKIPQLACLAWMLGMIEGTDMIGVADGGKGIRE
jgi:hypothetical protein